MVGGGGGNVEVRKKHTLCRELAFESPLVQTKKNWQKFTYQFGLPGQAS
jgi:hypothetical protein